MQVACCKRDDSRRTISASNRSTAWPRPFNKCYLLVCTKGTSLVLSDPSILSPGAASAVREDLNIADEVSETRRDSFCQGNRAIPSLPPPIEPGQAAHDVDNGESMWSRRVACSFVDNGGEMDPTPELSTGMRWAPWSCECRFQKPKKNSHGTELTTTMQ